MNVETCNKISYFWVTLLLPQTKVHGRVLQFKWTY